MCNRNIFLIGGIMRINKIILLLIFIFVSSCIRNNINTSDTDIDIIIDSISSNNITPKKTYCLFPGNEDTTADNLQYMEFSEFIHEALTHNGYKYVSDINKADTAVYLAYGVGAPKTNIYTKTTPIYGVTGVSSSTTYGSISASGNISATTTYSPTYGITGAITSTGTYSTYFKYLIVDAYDVDRSGGGNKLRQLFKTTVSYSNISDDLRRYFPIMAIASIPYIGTDTKAKIKISFGENELGMYLSKKNLQFSDNVVIDTRSGLMWAKNANLPGKCVNWENANIFVSNLEYSGYKDWRLPTNEELNSIAKYGGSSPYEGLNNIGFNNVQYDYYWSSSRSENTNRAWVYGMDDPNKYEFRKFRRYCVWPVRYIK